MKKTKKKSTRSKKSFKNAYRFRLATTSGRLLPLQTIRERLVGIWDTLTWPIWVKILKANIAVTIALSLLLIDPIREVSSVGAILASVAVEFVYPNKSYGFIAEDVIFGGIMCSISASWAILGQFLASLARDPNDAQLAQPKVEQANVGGMLSASIMVISLTSAVMDRGFSPLTTIRLLVSTLVGFALIFICFLVIFPENSTRTFVQHLIKVFEKVDSITERQVSSFLQVTQSGKSDITDSLTSIHNTVDAMITTLIQKKRMVRREPSYNYIAPTDVSELSSLIKTLRVPIQGLGLSRAMEENMRKAETKVFQDMEQMQDMLDEEEQDGHFVRRPRSFYGGTDDDEESTDDDDDENTDQDISDFIGPQFPSSSASSSFSTTSTTDSSRTRKRRVRWNDSMKVMSYWRQDYDDVLNIVKPTYLELTEACSLAIKESVKRLRRLQGLDPRFEYRPFLYCYYYRWKVGEEQMEKESKEFEYARLADPSLRLFEAMQKFHDQRLVGLEKLYTKSGVPRRILFLLLTFQFNLHAYAESVYTLSSLIYELDQVRIKKKVWWPHLSISKWLFQRHKTEESYALDTPSSIADAVHPLTLQKTLSRRATVQRDLQNQEDLERNGTSRHKMKTPNRGQAHSPKEHHFQHPYDHAEKPKPRVSPWLQNTLDPLEYYDPDVAYPTTATQRFFYSIYTFLIKYLYTEDTAFSFRAAVVVACLSLPGFLESSVRWYNEVRGQWAVVVALIWMGPSVGSNFFGTMTRTVGTFIGAVEAIVIWEISRGSVPGLIILSFIFNIPWWLVYIHGKFWKATGLFSLITLSLIIGYAYGYRPNGIPVSVYVITWERTVDVLVGVLAALIVSIIPYPRTGRVVLRHRISHTLSEIGALYSSFLALLLKTTPQDERVRNENRKLFRSVASSIRRQIKGERVLLEQSRFEPALRGIFPEDKYLHILQILDNILSLMMQMEFSLDKVPLQWRMMIVADTWKERKAMISSFLIALHLGSNALTNKAPLPPYVLRPTKARRILTNRARKLSAMRFKHLGEREYTYFSAYLMNSEQLAVEIELLIATICDLVGPDSVSLWLNYKH
ncbi:hypothetical protein INT48_004862 [Thamnidium elegans]|uniref:Fusaric acid resistance protein n=1 Tax=Thamnidium elegans TaxID=101142 RepID=A0A8H7SU63_9FUNG|nr:hypothetical protein INT48_004862 [Thamnidium elegans]